VLAVGEDDARDGDLVHGAEPWRHNATARHCHATRRPAERPLRTARKLGLKPLI
jgi:hypothetical protein